MKLPESIRAKVTGFAIDHRKVAPGNVFGAFQGARFDGESVITQAVAAGAIAIVARPQAQVEGALHIAADEPRRAFARLAADFYAPFPPVTVAVTGTNGKTSTVEIVRQLWHLAGERAASIGTLGVTTAGEQVKAGSGGLTTPDIVTFLSNVAGLAREGLTHIAFEASSHGLAQFRTEGLPVQAAAFTNLTRDHLDYHETMEAYFEAKLRLFTEVLDADGTAIVWLDRQAAGAEYNLRVIEACKARGLKLLTVGPDGDDLKLTRRIPTLLGQSLTISAFGAAQTVTLPLIGGYQAANALVAAGLALATGGEPKAVLAALARIGGVRGRLERAVLTPSGAPVYVDYAHTPDALEAAIAALRPHTANRLILLFGCGGDRDRGKRPEMGGIAVRDADLVIVTDDNPRSEDPAAIRAEIMAAAPGATEVAGRAEAIRAALAAAKEGDVVLLAGKGHEQGQIVGRDVLPFDDAEVARAAARALA
ncbi:UDP-N-acetylmuramoyl-L-alanyl-D-glutamate--2,6-diaminopimelate ligase [Sandaracinobacter sp. RS1-74]|uniref:UDP-N-acetylmuramoyl-L-alanyl-D-glutamate--2, 6-diaminopimelate ligase n=1 Tax=Sandaracinobacteroides sayramensis TaxID=2913411 RepID=UPI001EDBD0F3|nr:UDP-N-acetylmuramoyl-L-alanyl-D-glutamate--2,6-diaminopimelate ligase [Sandaracinobacteroides sayramensis]MCG2840479.1 UDP-N-acetylmuramoyl-L-alanyl-D-glutamate--2,6-diaminopimelate ligase [Sandaracinobacteroides sayramensis]